MGVLDGQPVSAAITNPAFINKNQNDQMPNVLGFDRISGSGPAIADIQNSVNNIYNATGVSESTTGTVYNATPNTISNGESYQNCLTALANKFDAATGHHHTGGPGDGPPISGGLIGGVPLEQFTEQGSSFAASGNSNIVTSLLAGKVPSNSSGIPGVIVSNPQNRIAIFGATYGQLNDANGNEVYGRLSASGSVFTLTYYSQVNGLETAYTFAASANIQWFYRELFQPLVSTPVYQPLGGFEISPKLVSTLSASGSSGIFGDITLAGSGGTIVGQVGQVIRVFVPPSTGGVSTLSVSGSTPLMGSVILQASGGIALTQTGQNIAISTTTPGGVTLNPTETILSAGSSGTYTPPTGCVRVDIEMTGAGGGGQGSGTSPGTGTDGGNTTLGSLTCNGGSKGSVTSGGTATGGDINVNGVSGGAAAGATNNPGGFGGQSPFGGAGVGNSQQAGGTATGYGSGGAGGGTTATVNTGGGGGAAGWLIKQIDNPTAMAYSVGSKGTGGSAGVGGSVGANGQDGLIYIREYYNNLAVSLVGSVAANLILAGPSSGGAAQPTFRSLVSADLPNTVSAVKTTTYAIQSTDFEVLVDASGTSWTATLPTAVGVTGKIYNISCVVGGDSTHIVTIATTGGQTIGGSSTKRINTLNECWTLISDGSNWQILGHRIPSAWTSYTPTFSASFGSTTNVGAFWRRSGDSMQVRVTFTDGTVTAATAKVSLPSGYTFTNMSASNELVGYLTQGAATAPGACTVITVNSDTSNFQFSRQDGSIAGLNPQNTSAIISGSAVVSFYAQLQITGWDD